MWWVSASSSANVAVVSACAFSGIARLPQDLHRAERNPDHPLVRGDRRPVAGHPLGGADQGLEKGAGFLALEDQVRALLFPPHRR